MRTLRRNKRDVYYSTYSGVSYKTVDGEKTGEKEITRGTPTLLQANVSAEKGTAQQELFGTSLNYDKVIVTDKMNLPIDENTLLWVDIPVMNGLVQNKPDYKVVRVSRSLNSVSIAIKRRELNER